MVNFFPVFPNLVVVYIGIVRYNFNVRQKIKGISIFTSLLLVILTFMPNISFANGGDQRVVEGKYLINLSRSPFTPKAGENVSMLASFVDIQTDKLITEDLIVKIRIAKLGEGRSNREFTFEQKNLTAKTGILEFRYVFTESGLHEIFFDFAFASNPQKVYNAPDFLLDIQKSKIDQKATFSFPIGITLGAIFGFMIGWLIKRQNV